MIDHDAPQVLRQFYNYIETVRGKSPRTADEYYRDLRIFFRWLLWYRGLVAKDTPFNEISIAPVNVELLAAVELSDVYEYMHFLSRERPSHPRDPNKGYGIGASARARKVASLRSFYKYLTVTTHQIETNPVANLEPPKRRKSLPKYLTVDQSLGLLSGVTGPNTERDLAILTIFLNCGIRVSELCAISLSDIKEDTLVITGKGNKQRIVYLNPATKAAIDSWMAVRAKLPSSTSPRLFITRQSRQISPSTVKWLVKKHLSAAGISAEGYSAHKLRHTAATLMYQNGVDVRVLQEVLGHENLDTTKIYTHIDNASVREAFMKNPLSGAKDTNSD
ncbi:MAG: tyrosine recombinase XerC [Clostridia bacterium]|nr:tyrosine recombinase XerC [Clostridia bacterium]